jgi:restriction system protein
MATIDPHHFPPDVLQQLGDTIPLLARSKRDVLTFFKGAGVPSDTTSDIEAALKADRDSWNKFAIARAILVRVNDGGDPMLRPRREIVRRVVEFSDFSTCWSEDQDAARGKVAALRERVNQQDAFTRMANERSRESAERRAVHEQAISERRDRTEKIQAISTRLNRLFGEADAHRRGKALEPVLNDLFAAFGIGVRQAFELRGATTNGVIEQIDGVIELDGHLYLVEMKWYAQNIGVSETAQALVRAFTRSDARSLIIANPGFTLPAIEQVKTALAQKTVVLATLEEIVRVLARQGDLREMLRTKVQSAVIDRLPYVAVAAP